MRKFSTKKKGKSISTEDGVHVFLSL